MNPSHHFLPWRRLHTVLVLQHGAGDVPGGLGEQLLLHRDGLHGAGLYLGQQLLLHRDGPPEDEELVTQGGGAKVVPDTSCQPQFIVVGRDILWQSPNQCNLPGLINFTKLLLPQQLIFQVITVLLAMSIFCCFLTLLVHENTIYCNYRIETHCSSSSLLIRGPTSSWRRPPAAG